ncbi:MAG: P-II family nitrogen regulator [Lentisphaerae bacterium]|jgi:nitrogen regulatory protein PII|nr:P-II family nitrogen regulator [Lentisphaerota bacterium]
MSAEAVFCVVERGKADRIVKKAVKAGARGATIFYGRGAGADTFSFFHNLNVESSKEIIVIIVTEKTREPILSALLAESHVDEEGRGILFTIPITEVHGINNL